MNTRIYVEKKQRYQTEANDLCKDIQTNLNIPIQGLRLLQIYDVFDIDEAVLETAKHTVFSEPMVDTLLEDIDLSTGRYIAKEFLPGQYDQRADSAMQCIHLLNPNSHVTIRSGQIILLNGDISDEQYQQICSYLINPIEARVKDLSVLSLDMNVEVAPMEDLTGFIQLSKEEIASFVNSHGMAMSTEDLLSVQDYFKNVEKRDPRETEIKVLDTYWSDHCRHTTFETCLESVVIDHSRFEEDIQAVYEDYLAKRHICGRDKKPQTLMDMATINARYLKKMGKHEDVERSEEINACSVYVDVDVDGTIEKWLMMFKNETHNHPTEIEPFGGASTCIGGAIRDPLSGRSYVYQAMRISGCGNIMETIEQTIPSKLPQRVISKKATHGNSSYGNQIGLPTTFVKEIYHPNYVAKHLELGAVCGAVKADQICRETLVENDVILLIGGNTGRDGIGGATGSSKEHNDSSLLTCATEVQKGNAPEERKIQRLFRNPEVTKMIKKCNDFGAGGVCVAIGELADGLHIQLDRVRLKYAGLNATEIAISESQERMAVGVAKKDAERLIELAAEENLLAYVVARVTNDRRLVMTLHDEVVVDLSRDFIDTSGVRQHTDVIITDSAVENPLLEKEVTKESILNMMSSLNCACQKGISEMFDASIGSTTVLMPQSGKTQLTPTQVSVQRFPVLNHKTNTCSIMAYGFQPSIMMYSPYIGAQAAILSSISKTVACGGHLKNIHFSFQEYFERLQKDPKRWGKAAQALLGAMKVQSFFDKGAIGGKDSMSGTFNQIDVPPTFVSFACSSADARNIIVPHFTKSGHIIQCFYPKYDSNGLFDLNSYQTMFKSCEEEIQKGNILSAYVVEDGGVIEACLKMSFGQDLGFILNKKCHGLDLIPGAIVCEVTTPIDGWETIGQVTEKDYRIEDITLNKEEVMNAWMSSISTIYPLYAKHEGATLPIHDAKVDTNYHCLYPTDEVRVCIPVFPGTNCEYDMKRAFEDEGAKGTIVVFQNQSESQIFDSITRLVKELDRSHILAIPGGFSSGDEPDGSAKFIVNVLQNEHVKAAVERLLARDGLILGICNGFQALIKSGLLPYGTIKKMDGNDATLYRNTINRHVSTMAHTRVASNKSPWLQGFTIGEDHMIAMSHGEGRFVLEPEQLKQLQENGQIAFQYCDFNCNPTMDPVFNINNSDFAIEGIVSSDGHILGKMGHSERYQEGLFINIEGNKKQNIFKNGVDYFRK
ncbi:MAG: phosphoribosylformylglycinamidine synthase [Erysipelotrichaceae bacterium]|nr:phosphoribosylformylglycinamidine synthase [Erysipelotrichaceae bacterium]